VAPPPARNVERDQQREEDQQFHVQPPVGNGSVLWSQSSRSP
jgi:hypothetical protein